jgi:predicted nucleic acid-binding protein
MSEEAEAEAEQKPNSKGEVAVLCAIGVPTNNPMGVVVNSGLPVEETLTLLLRAAEKVRWDLFLARLRESESKIVRPKGAIPPWQRG